jgi:hypothetical protein
MERLSLKEVKQMLEGTTISHSGDGVNDLGMGETFTKLDKMTEDIKTKGLALTTSIISSPTVEHSAILQQSRNEAKESSYALFFYGTFEINNQDHFFCLGHDKANEDKKVLILANPDTGKSTACALTTDSEYNQLKKLIHSFAHAGQKQDNDFNEKSGRQTYDPEKQIRPSSPKRTAPKRL